MAHATGCASRFARWLAEDEGVAVFAGPIFYPDGDGGFNGIRLSYANATPDRIVEGVRRLHRAVATVTA